MSTIQSLTPTGWTASRRAVSAPVTSAAQGEVVGIALDARLAETLNDALADVAVRLRLVEARSASPAALAGASVILVGQGMAESRHELVASIRQSAPAAAVLLVAEPGDDFAAVLGLELGADAFVRTDEGCRVLMSQVRAMLRQSGRWRVGVTDLQDGCMHIGRTVLEHDASSVRIDDRCHALPRQQFSVLWALAGSAGRVVDRERLARLVEVDSGCRYPRQVDTVVCRLRARLAELQSGLRIRSVRSVGYLLSVIR